MMQTIKRLSLDEFKTRAENVEKNEVLEKINGGNQYDCHGFWGQTHKLAVSIAEAINSYH